MVPVRVLGMAVDGALQPLVLLTPLDEDDGPRRVVPIWIGPQEAASIAVAVNGETPPRPLSHDLMQRLLEAVSAEVDRVDITRIVDGTFFAELGLTTAAGPVVIDCRPSDAIALAVRIGAPLFVAESVLDAAAVTEEPEGQDEGSEEDRIEAFRTFLDGVDPQDFAG